MFRSEKQREQRWSEKNKAKIRAFGLKRRYGTTPERWTEMFASQGNKCAVCRTTDAGSKHGWQTDHCHATGKIRGILCHGCNIGLGGFRDNEEILLAASIYLRVSRA